MKMTRWISLILCLAMLSTLVAFPVWAEETGEQTAWEELLLSYEESEAEEGNMENIEIPDWVLEEDGKARASSRSESEPNNSLAAANTVYADDTIAGSVSAYDPLDYFKITISKKSKLVIASAATKDTLVFGLRNAADTSLGWSRLIVSMGRD